MKVLFGTGAALIVVGVVYWSQRESPVDEPLVPSPRVVRLDAPPNAERKFVDVALTATNKTSRPIKILGVDSGCRCVREKGVVGTTIPPRSQATLTFEVETPEHGTQRTKIAVYHDGGPAPFVVFVDADGATRLPVRMQTINPSPIFLTSPPAPQDTVIITRELAKSKPWIERIVCDAPQVRVSLREMVEKSYEDYGFVERRYTFEITLGDPRQRGELLTRLYASTRGTSKDRFIVGDLRSVAP